MATDVSNTFISEDNIANLDDFTNLSSSSVVSDSSSYVRNCKKCRHLDANKIDDLNMKLAVSPVDVYDHANNWLQQMHALEMIDRGGQVLRNKGYPNNTLIGNYFVNLRLENLCQRFKS